MTLQTSGPISLADVSVESYYSSTSTRALGDSVSRYLANRPTGIISLYAMYGRSILDNIDPGPINIDPGPINPGG